MSAKHQVDQPTSIETRKEIVEKLDKGTSIYKLMREYKISAYTVRRIIRDKDKIKKLDKSQLHKKKLYSKYNELEEKLYKLYEEIKESGNKDISIKFITNGLKLMEKFGGPKEYKAKLQYLERIFNRFENVPTSNPSKNLHLSQNNNKPESEKENIFQNFKRQLEEGHIKKDDIYIMFETKIALKSFVQETQRNQNQTDITKFKNDRLVFILCTNVTGNHILSPLIIYEYEDQAIKSKLKNKEKVIFKLIGNKSEDQQILTNWYDDYVMSVRKHQQKTNKVFLLANKRKKYILPAHTNQSNDFEVLPYLQGPKFNKAKNKVYQYIRHRLKKLNCTFYNMKIYRQEIFKIWQESSPKLIRNLCENLLKSDSRTKENIPEGASTKSLDIQYKATKEDYDPDNPIGLRKCIKLSVKRYPDKVGNKDLNEQEIKALALLTLCEKNQSCKTTEKDYDLTDLFNLPKYLAKSYFKKDEDANTDLDEIEF